MVILHACKKQGRKARKEDLDLSKARMKDELAPIQWTPQM
jgi:phage-related protein